MLIGAIIVTYNRPQQVTETARSVLAQTEDVSRLVVVDNGPPGPVAEDLDALPVDLLRLGDNLGFSGGLAAGMRHLRSQGTYDYYWLLDDDSPVEPGSLRRALSDLRELPPAASLANRGAQIRWTGVKPIPTRDHPILADVALVDGGLFSGEAVDAVGTPRPDVFMVFEDYEFTTRLRRAGYPVFISSAVRSRAQHLGSQGPSSRWRAYYQTRNHLRSAIDLRDPRLLSSGLVRLGKQLVWLQLHGGDDKWTVTRLRMRGMHDAVRGRMGRTLDPARGAHESGPNRV